MRSQRHGSRKPAFLSLFCTFQGTLWGLAALFATGCGQTAAPQPPSLELPAPVADLAAIRIADRVLLSWTMPRRTTDRLLLKGPQLVHICRKVGGGPCATVADASFPPEKPATYEDRLPAGLTGGAPQALTYLVEVRNRRGRSAGESNAAWAAAGAAPPPLADLRGEITADGVLLAWQPVTLPAGGGKVSIRRTLLSSDAAAKRAGSSKPALGAGASAPVKEQVLVVPLPAGDSGRALDPDAAFDRRYSYSVYRVAMVAVAGRFFEIEGPTSSAVMVDTKDTFPPQPPTGLAAVGDPEQGAIDLSWTPDSESDLAGYAVYRRAGDGRPQRVSGGAPLATPSFRDQTAQPGHRYGYSVSAIDADGNESAPSTESVEGLPAKP